MTSATRPYEFMDVNLDLVDSPDDAMRQTFDPTKLEELIDSIRQTGLINPPSLVRAGERYRVVEGHRRTVACVAAGLPVIPAKVYPEGTPNEEVLKNHENAFREDVNAAEEAVYFNKLLETKCGGDVMKLCGLTGRKQSYVEGRLDLLRGYPDVLQALIEGRISVSVARELNRYKDESWMKPHLETAMVSGAKATQVAHWRTDLERNLAQYPQVESDGSAAPAGQPMEPPKMSCAVCGGSKDPYNLEFMYVHRGGPCMEMLDRFLTRMAGGE